MPLRAPVGGGGEAGQQLAPPVLANASPPGSKREEDWASPSRDPELSLWAGTGAFGEGLRPAEYVGIRVLADPDGGGQAQLLLPHMGGGLGSALWGAGLDGRGLAGLTCERRGNNS